MVSYSALIMCHLLRWCVSSPAHCGWDGIFIAVGTELDFSQASAICLPSGHWRPFIADTVRRHIPCTAERRCCWAHVCALAQASQSPGEAPGVRQSVSMPLRNEVGKIVPVVCPQMSPGCSTPVLGAFPFMCGEIVGGGCCGVQPLPSVHWSVLLDIPTPLTGHLPRITQNQWGNCHNVVCTEMKNCPEFTVEAAAFSQKQSNPFQGNP